MSDDLVRLVYVTIASALLGGFVIGFCFGIMYAKKRLKEKHDVLPS